MLKFSLSLILSRFWNDIPWQTTNELPQLNDVGAGAKKATLYDMSIRRVCLPYKRLEAFLIL